MKKIILASGSPRRRELLGLLGRKFEVKVSHCQEVITQTDPAMVTIELARQKAEAVAAGMEKDGIVLGADTVVAIEGEILGKPADKREAEKMISKIQGKSHEVYTGVALLVVEKGKILQTKVLAEKTLVETAPMTPDEIQHYIQGKEPYDKAGGYGIQGEFAICCALTIGDAQQFFQFPEDFAGTFYVTCGTETDRYLVLTLWL